MAEIMEEKKELTPAETAAPASPETPAKKPEKSTADKKKRRRTIRRIVALVVVAALIAGGVKFFKKKDGSSEVGMATVSYGAISSEVDGSGLVKAKTSETLTLATARTVQDVFVEEGQQRDYQPDHCGHGDGCIRGGGTESGAGGPPVYH